jgi:hypothetical protein
MILADSIEREREREREREQGQQVVHQPTNHPTNQPNKFLDVRSKQQPVHLMYSADGANMFTGMEQCIGALRAPNIHPDPNRPVAHELVSNNAMAAAAAAAAAAGCCVFFNRSALLL